MSKAQQQRIHDLEEIITHLQTEVELKDYWIETFSHEHKYAQAVQDWRTEGNFIMEKVWMAAKLLGDVVDMLDEGGEDAL
jgi:hypothetical protein